MDNRLTQFTDNAHLGGLASSIEARILIQKNSLSLQEWLEIWYNWLKKNTKKYEGYRQKKNASTTTGEG